MNDRITAEELRAIGVPIPGHIPGAASIPKGAIRIKIDDCTTDGSCFEATVRYTFDESFEWIELEFTVDS